MEAQNAADSPHTKPAPPHPRPSQSEPGGDASAGTSTGLTTPSSPAKDSRPRTEAAQDDSLADLARDDDRDSDAETIVLPGKQGRSPSQVRNERHEDKSDSDGQVSVRTKARPKPGDSDAATGAHHDASTSKTPSSAPVHGHSDVAKRKRSSISGLDKDRGRDGLPGSFSSGPSSPQHEQPISVGTHPKPPIHQHSALQRPSPSRRRRSDAARSEASDSEQNLIHIPTKTSSQTLLRDKIRVAAERPQSHKRKASRGDSEDEADARKARRQRTASAGLEMTRSAKDSKSLLSKSTADSNERSMSPLSRHRRSISSQFPYLQNGFGSKKKRLPPPLQPTDYHSDDSSAGGSPLPRNAKLRSLVSTPAAGEKASPAKMGPHKKHLDAHGQTHLARACARGEYEAAKQRLTERPEDLNVADYAGNTPLQIAAINGCEDIVKLLIEAGCNLDCVNYDKDTPLLDAVDNGHLGVIKLLLDAGVNPRKANVNGEEPLDRVSDDTDNATEIRAALIEARKRAGERQRTSEDRHSHHEQPDARDVNVPDSPRHSPAATAFASTGRRTGTVRSTKTRNDLLYMPLDEKTLRQAAGRGDEETVARILQVKEGYDDPEAMVAAARGGHDVVMELLLSLGSPANADPAPVPSLPAEFATPILAAIGQENLKAVQLFLRHDNFDPTRRFRGETYYEIARRRQGPNWKEEEQLLKNAYDEYKRSHKEVSKTKSPSARRERERDRQGKAGRREEAKDGSKSQAKRTQSSPGHEGEAKKKTVHSRVPSPLEKRRSDAPANRGDDESQKRPSSTRPKKDATNISDGDNSPAPPPKSNKPKRTESDITGMSSDGEATAKPRRKLVSKGELSRERDKQRRALLEPTSPREPRPDEGADKSKLSQKYHDRAKALRRDESMPTVSSEGPSKRHRKSETPDRPSDGDRDHSESPVKRRRLDSDNPSEERRQRRTLSVDSRARKIASSRDHSGKTSLAVAKKERDDESRDSQEYSSARSGVEKSIHVKSEDFDTPLIDIEQPRDEQRCASSRAGSDVDEHAKKQELESDARKEDQRRKQELEEKKKRKKRDEDAARKRREEEDLRKRQETEEALKRQEEEEKQRKEEERRRKAEEESKKREEEESQRRRQQQAERERREAEEAARREEAEQKRRLEEGKRRREEEEEEEERQRQQEEERLYREQLEREAAEEAQRRREEEERREQARREQEQRERAQREELERRRIAQEEEQRRVREAQQERERIDKLPPLMRWLQTCPNPKTSANASKFGRIQGARYDTIRTEANGTAAGREMWILNTDVALLLGDKDLDLSKYSSWDREQVTMLAKTSIWRTQWVRQALTVPSLWDIGLAISANYYGEDGPALMRGVSRLKNAAWDRFAAMDMFFVKVSDFLYIVPSIPHLRDVKISVGYHELLESEEQSHWHIPSKWRSDPGIERFHGFSPRCTHYINGVMVGEDLPFPVVTSKTPFVEARVPRRVLTRAWPGDPDYEQLCREQGLEHLLPGSRTPALSNGVHASPTSQSTDVSTEKVTVNGVGPYPTQEAATRHEDDAASSNGIAAVPDTHGSQD